MKGTAFHIAAWINWWGKSPKFEFYNDEEDTEEQPPMPSKPRRRPTTETQAEFEERIRVWEAMKPHKVKKRVKGNHMIQKYYVERLLLIYVKAVQNERLRTQNQVYLQEDGDPSHDIRKEGLAAQLKKAN